MAAGAAVDSGSLWPEPASTRREFIRSAVTLIAGTSALAAGLTYVSLLRDPTAGPALVRSTFEPFVGQPFWVRSRAGGTHELELFKVRDLRTYATVAPGSGTDDNFSLLFRGPVGDPLDQDVYEIEHGRLRGGAILLAPMWPEPDARYYEAIFNRALPN